MKNQEAFENFRNAVIKFINTCRKQFGELIVDMFLIKRMDNIKFTDGPMVPFTIGKTVEFRFDSHEQLVRFEEALEKLPMGASLTDVHRVYEEIKGGKG